MAAKVRAPPRSEAARQRPRVFDRTSPSRAVRPTVADPAMMLCGATMLPMAEPKPCAAASATGGVGEGVGDAGLELGEEDVGRGGRAGDEGAEHPDQRREKRPERAGGGRASASVEISPPCTMTRLRASMASSARATGTMRASAPVMAGAMAALRPVAARRGRGPRTAAFRGGRAARSCPRSGCPKLHDSAMRAEGVLNGADEARGEDEREDGGVGGEVSGQRRHVGQRAVLLAAQDDGEETRPMSAPPRLGSSGPASAASATEGTAKLIQASASSRCPSALRRPSPASRTVASSRSGETMACMSAADPESAVGDRPVRWICASVGVPTAPKETPRRMAREREDHGADGRVAEACEQGCRKCDRGAEARRALHEEAEEPRDEDGLDALVAGQAGEGHADALQRADLRLELVERQRGQDDPEDGGGGTQRLRRRAGECEQRATRRWGEGEDHDGQRNGKADGPGARGRQMRPAHRDQDNGKRQRCEGGAHLRTVRRSALRRSGGRWVAPHRGACRGSGGGRRGCAGAAHHGGSGARIPRHR
jgi:hypothetical protein